LTLIDFVGSATLILYWEDRKKAAEENQ
jgi:hypothetical protein